MKFKVLKEFKAATTEGEKTLQPGEIITTPEEIAIKLITKGLIIPVEKVAFRLYSQILEAFLWVCADEDAVKNLTAKGTSYPIYTADEIEKLKGTDKETLKEINEVKKTFPGSTIREHKKGGKK